jgi:hypothetical protein
MVVFAREVDHLVPGPVNPGGPVGIDAHMRILENYTHDARAH